MIKSKIVLRISFALATFSATLILIAYSLGFLPDEEKAGLQARANIAESLAVQLVTEAGQRDLTAIRKTIRSVVERNREVLSIALRQVNGRVLIQAGNHKKNWVEPKNDISTATHVKVPILNDKVLWGTIELVFTPLAKGYKIFGIPIIVITLIGFLGIMGLTGNYFVLRRTLRELDPSKAVPERVQKAFDTLVEGVLILDERELILLTNESFSKEVETGAGGENVLLGTKITDLPWCDRNTAGDFPWRVAIRDGKSVVGAPLSMTTLNGKEKKFTVNATRITDPKGGVTGAIVTFDDITEIEQKNAQLTDAITSLKEKEVEIKLKNNELHHLATRDPLTDCLNRRAFFENFELIIERARLNEKSVYCMMMDLDHFKNVNDTYGHGVGDEVIVMMGDILKSACRDSDVAGRYGGEEFCVALYGLTQEHCIQVAERIRLAVIARSKEIAVLDGPVTTSIGMALLTDDIENPNELVDRADKALYAAKSSGRNKIVEWNDTDFDDQAGSNAVEAIDESDPAEADNPRQPPARQNPDAIAVPFAEPLGGLSREQAFLDRVSQSLIRSARNDTIVALLYITVAFDHGLSEIASDQAEQDAMQSVRSRFSKLLRGTDTVTLVDSEQDTPAIHNLSTNTLVLQITDLKTTDTVTWIVKRLFNSLSAPIFIDDEAVYCSAKMGISLFPIDGSEPEKLLQSAKTAGRYANENLGANSLMFCSQELNDNSNRQIALADALAQAMVSNQLSLQYQPVMDMRSGQVKSVEALLRCSDDVLRDVPATVLIRIAEQSGMIIELGEWIFATAIKQYKSWVSQDIALAKISINLSSYQLANQKGCERLLAMLDEFNVAPGTIQIEITEGALMDNRSAIKRSIKQFQGRGVEIVLDDFGTGYTSLTHVRQLRPEVIKVDRSFIQEISGKDSDVSLIASIIAMAHEFGAVVVAEGIETTAQLDRLVELNCDFAQGYIVSRPMTEELLEDWLKLFTKQQKSGGFETVKNLLSGAAS